MTTLAPRIQSVRPSATMALDGKVKALQAAGEDIIGLVAGEPDFPTPDHVIEAAAAAMRNGQTKYTAVAGTPEMKSAVQTKFQRDNGLEFTLEQIIVSSGAKQCCYNLCQALLGPGDEAVIPAPYWVSYVDMVRLAGAEPRIVATTAAERFLVRPEALEAAISPKTRLLFLNSPSNPAGTAYSGLQLEAFGKVLERYPRVVVLTDDIYEHIYWAAEPFKTLLNVAPQLAERVITVNGVSKAYAMTGWRIGYAAGPKTLISAMSTIQSQSTSNPCSVAQAAAIAALAGDQSGLETRREAFRRRHDLVVAAVNDIEGLSAIAGDGTFYCFIEASEVIDRFGMKDDFALAEHLLETAKLALVPGSAFGQPGHLRLTFATDETTLSEALRRLRKGLE